MSSSRVEGSVDTIANARMGKRRRMSCYQEGFTELPSQDPAFLTVALQPRTANAPHYPHVLSTPPIPR